MRVLITGAAGNLGSHLVRHLLPSRHDIRAVIHRTPLPPEIADAPRVEVCRANLAQRASLYAACAGVDCIVHLAGVLFGPQPARFLPTTNVQYVRNLL